MYCAFIRTTPWYFSHIFSTKVEEKDASEWLGKGGAKAKLDNEKPQGETVKYDDLIAEWSAAQ